MAFETFDRGLLRWIRSVTAFGILGCHPPTDPPPVFVLERGERLQLEDDWGELQYFDVSEQGMVAVLDRFAGRVAVIGTGGRPEYEFGERGHGPAEVQQGGPVVIVGNTVVMADGNRVLVQQGRGDPRTFAGVAASGIIQWSDSTVGLVERDVIDGRSTASVREFFPTVGRVGDTLLAAKVLAEVEDTICRGCGITRGPDRSFLVTTSDPRGVLLRVSGVGRGILGRTALARERVPWPTTRWERYVRRARQDFAFSTPEGMRGFVGSNVGRPVPVSAVPMRVFGFQQATGVDGDGNTWILINTGDLVSTTLEVLDDSGKRSVVVIPGRSFEAVEVEGSWLVGLEFDPQDRPILWRFNLAGWRGSVRRTEG